MHTQDDLNLRVLLMFKGTFSLDSVHMTVLFDFAKYLIQATKIHCQLIQKLYLVFVCLTGLNDTSALVGHFVSSPRERKKRDRRDSRGDEKEGQWRKSK